jgi:hypothetical protein
MRAVARKLGAAPVSLQVSDLEKQAARVVPRTTARVKENGYQGWQEYLPSGGRGMGAAGQPAGNPWAKTLADARAKYPLKGSLNTSELQLLINGQHSALDIKYLLDAQSQPRGDQPAPKADLQDILNYLEQLKAVGLVEK